LVSHVAKPMKCFRALAFPQDTGSRGHFPCRSVLAAIRMGMGWG
jgi:hypothetical protein